jgi:DNA-binding response OmpR family regulator
MTNQMMPSILIVDDDEAICKTLSTILHAEGYQTTTATTAKEALEKAKTQFFNLALLDIKLPDLEGTRLLAQLQGIAPETIKIMITGYPSLKNAVEALNLGADSYTMKPINPAELLKTIKNKLEAQKLAENITKEKLAEWVLSQARKTQSSNFQEFLEQTSNELADFGLTKTEAKIYITLASLGVASASEIAAPSKIRREEVYRIMPELEKHGIITRKLKTPRKFSAIKPEKALEILTQAKLNSMKEEIDKLKQKQAELISKLKIIELPIKQEDCSIEVVTQRDNIAAKLTEMTTSARREINIIAHFHNLKTLYVNRPRKLMERVLKSLKIRIITEKCALDTFTKEIMQFAEKNNNPIELRQVEELPFTLLITDEKEAAWGQAYVRTQNETPPLFWTNDPMQIDILKRSFENLWEKSQA